MRRGGKFILLPLTKGPCAKGRIDPRKWQDWYRSLIVARKLAPKYENAPVLILSNLQVEGERHEADIYCEAAQELGITNLATIRETCETMGQLEYAIEMARNERITLVVISTWLRFPRVWWLCRGYGVKHHVAWGHPPSVSGHRRHHSHVRDAGYRYSWTTRVVQETVGETPHQRKIVAATRSRGDTCLRG